MERTQWQDFLVARDGDQETSVWELFHENSKIGRYDPPVNDKFVSQRMLEIRESLSFDTRPEITWPETLIPLSSPLDRSLSSRRSERIGGAPAFSSKPILPQELATILYYSYGVTRNKAGTPFPRDFRTVPSAGALYPLEIFFLTLNVNTENLSRTAICHFNPTKPEIRIVRDVEEGECWQNLTAQKALIDDASILVFITALFERSTFKYHERGYRFALIESGHVAQNINLAANALGFGCVNIGGFFDRDVDGFLGLDGLGHSALYLVAIGGASK